MANEVLPLEHPEAVVIQARAGLKGTQTEWRARKQIAKLQEPSRKIAARAGRLQAISGAVKTGMTLADWLKPIIIGALILFFIIGPGITAIFTIIQSMNIWMWLGVIIIILLILKNR